MPAEQHSPAKPVVVALLTSDGIHRDLGGKCYILGVFNRISASKFPASHPATAIYLALTEGYGETAITLRLIDVQENSPLYVTTTKTNFTNPIEVKEFTSPIPPITFPHPGEYQWQVVCDGEVLFERRLNLKLNKPPASD